MYSVPQKKHELATLPDHLEIQHSLNMLEDDSEYLDVEHVISAWEIWMENETPTPNPRLYDSVNECEISEFDSSSEDDNDEEEPPKLIPLPAKLKRTESSSAESSLNQKITKVILALAPGQTSQDSKSARN